MRFFLKDENVHKSRIVYEMYSRILSTTIMDNGLAKGRTPQHFDKSTTSRTTSRRPTTNPQQIYN